MAGEDLYKQDGVNIDLGDAFSAFCAKLGKTTYNSSPFVRMFDLSRDNFRGPRGFQLATLPDGYYQTGTVDGIGTKVVIIDAAGCHITSANNLVAMVAMDITRYGGLPLIMFNLLDVRSLGKDLDDKTYRACQEIARGLQQVCLAERYVMFTGETAELGLGVGSENPDATVMFNWGAMMFGVYHPDKMILGDTLRPGQVVVVLRDDLRSNGISSVRKGLAMKHGLEWWSNKDAMPDIIAAASPSALYDRMLNDAHGWFNPPDFEPRINMHLVVHLSGGAFKSKLGEDMLKPLGLSANLTDLFEPPPIMKKCAQWRGMSDNECYKTWNGGQGAAIVVDAEDVEAFIAKATSYGIQAKAAGVITERNPDYTVAITSKFSGETIHY